VSAQEPGQEPRRDRRAVPAWAWPVGALILAFLIRLVGIGWGLPNELHHQSYHPDEYLLYSVASSIDLGAGKWDPQFYNYGSLWPYAMSITMKVALGWGLVASDAGLELACRLLSALLGSLTVMFAFLIGRRAGGLACGIAAAGALMVAPGHVVHSRFHTVDAPATFFVTASLLLALRALQEEDARRAMWSAVWGFLLAGLAASVKYNTVLVVLPVALAVALRPWPAKTRAWVVVVGLVWAVAGFLLTTPGVLYSSARFWHDFTFEMRHASEGHGLVFVDTAPGALYHLGNLVQVLGWGVPIVALFGIARSLSRKDRAAWVLLAFLVPYYALIAVPEVKFLRYTLPIAPVLCVFAGYALASGIREKLLESRWAVVAGAALVLGAATGNNLVSMTELMVRPDSRDQAAAWLRGNARGKRIGFPTVPWFYTPPLFPDTGAGVGERGAVFRLTQMAKATEFKLLYYWPEGQAHPPEWEPGLLAALQPDYVVCSSFEFEDQERIARYSPEKVPGYTECRELLNERYELKRAFGYAAPRAHDLEYVSPRILIWQRKPAE
jgi:hypothetical protein